MTLEIHFWKDGGGWYYFKKANYEVQLKFIPLTRTQDYLTGANCTVSSLASNYLTFLKPVADKVELKIKTIYGGSDHEETREEERILELMTELHNQTLEKILHQEAEKPTKKAKR